MRAKQQRQHSYIISNSCIFTRQTHLKKSDSNIKQKKNCVVITDMVIGSNVLKNCLMIAPLKYFFLLYYKCKISLTMLISWSKTWLTNYLQ